MFFKESNLLSGGEEIYSNAASRTASIRSRSGSGRVSTNDLDRLSAPTAVLPPAAPVMPKNPRVYASVAEMKRMKVSRSIILKKFRVIPYRYDQKVRGRKFRLS